MTGQEEKLTAVEDEMRKVKENYDRQKAEQDELERKFAQVIEEKGILAEQLQAETELAAEAEEVSSCTSKANLKVILFPLTRPRFWSVWVGWSDFIF